MYQLRKTTGHIDVLLVDKDSRFQDRFERVALALGMVVKTVTGPEQFFDALRSCEVGVIALSEEMKGFSGLSLEEFFTDRPMVYIGSQRFGDYLAPELAKKITRYISRSFGPHSVLLATREVMQSMEQGGEKKSSHPQPVSPKKQVA